jgi:hypothetical protein
MVRRLEPFAGATSLLTYLSQPVAVAKLMATSGGYDLPSFANLTGFKTWADEGPPKGTLYHYPTAGNYILDLAGGIWDKGGVERDLPP